MKPEPRRLKPVSSYLFSFVSALALIVLAQAAGAEVACIAEVSYRWTREQSAPAAEAAGLAKSAGSRGAVEPTRDVAAAGSSASAASANSAGTKLGATPSSDSPTPQGSVPGEQKVRFAQVERRGQDERAVRAGLQIEVNRQKARAYERCKRDHESFGECVSIKMSTKGATLNSLSFSARSKVEEALIDECRVQQGRCVSIDSDEPSCRDLAPRVGSSDGALGATNAEGGSAKTSVKEATKDVAKPAVSAAGDKAKSAKKKP